MSDDQSTSDEPELINSLRAHKTGINSVAFSSDGSKIVSGSDDGIVVFWNLKGTKDTDTGLCYRLEGHKGSINAVDYASNDEFFVSASQDTHVRLWKLNSTLNKPNEEPVAYKCHGSNIRHVSLNHESTRFVTSSDDKTVKLWDANYRNKFIMSLMGHTNWVRSSKFCSTNTSLVASCGDDCMVLVHDIRAPVRSPPVHSISGSKGKIHSSSHFTSLDWFPLSDFLVAVGSTDASLRIYDLRQGQVVQYYESHNGPVNTVEFHKDGTHLISGSSDNVIKVYDLLEGRVLFTIRAHTAPIKCVRFTKDGKHFASTGGDKAIYLWKSNFESNCETAAYAGAGDASASSAHQISMSPLRVHDRRTTMPKTPSAYSRASLNSEKTSNNSNKSYNSSCQMVSERGRSRSSDFQNSTTVDGVSRRSGGHELRGINYSNNSNSTNGGGHGRTQMVSSSPSPESNLLQGIVSQISTLTDAISLIERRLSVVEQLVGGLNHK